VTNIQSERQIIGNALRSWYAIANGTSLDNTDLTSVADKNAGDVGVYLNMIALAVNQAIPSYVLPVSTLASYKVNVATARAEVVTVMGGLRNAEAALINAKTNSYLISLGQHRKKLSAKGSGSSGARWQ